MAWPKGTRRSEELRTLQSEMMREKWASGTRRKPHSSETYAADRKRCGYVKRTARRRWTQEERDARRAAVQERIRLRREREAAARASRDAQVLALYDGETTTREIRERLGIGARPVYESVLRLRRAGLITPETFRRTITISYRRGTRKK